MCEVVVPWGAGFAIPGDLSVVALDNFLALDLVRPHHASPARYH